MTRLLAPLRALLALAPVCLCVALSGCSPPSDEPPSGAMVGPLVVTSSGCPTGICLGRCGAGSLQVREARPWELLPRLDEIGAPR